MMTELILEFTLYIVVVFGQINFDSIETQRVNVHINNPEIQYFGSSGLAECKHEGKYFLEHIRNNSVEYNKMKIKIMKGLTKDFSYVYCEPNFYFNEENNLK